MFGRLDIISLNARSYPRFRSQTVTCRVSNLCLQAHHLLFPTTIGVRKCQLLWQLFVFLIRQCYLCQCHSVNSGTYEDYVIANFTLSYTSSGGAEYCYVAIIVNFPMPY